MLEIAEQLRSLIVERFDVRPDRILPDTDLVVDLGVSSLDFVDLVMAIEEMLGITIGDSDVDSMRTFSDAVALVESKRQLSVQ